MNILIRKSKSFLFDFTVNEHNKPFNKIEAYTMKDFKKYLLKYNELIA